MPDVEIASGFFMVKNKVSIIIENSINSITFVTETKKKY